MQLQIATYTGCVINLLAKLRSKRPPEQQAADERDLIAFVNEARSDAQRDRYVRAARRRAAAAGR